MGYLVFIDSRKKGKPSPLILNITGKLLNSYMITSMKPFLQISFEEPSSCRMGLHFIHRKTSLHIYTNYFKIISLNTDYKWAAHSPGLNSLDFWLWRAIKESVFADSPYAVEEIKCNAS